MKTPEYYKRFLPHIQPIGDTFFITARLIDTMPISILRELQSRKATAMTDAREKYKANAGAQQEAVYNVHKMYFKWFDDILDEAAYGPTYLANSEIAALIADKFHQYDGKLYQLIAFTVLSNHFHVLISRAAQKNEPSYVQLDGVMKFVKGGSAYTANKLLTRNGRFWHRESYDHVVRNGQEFYNIIRYIANNPVKAKLVAHWSDWAFTYVASDYLEGLGGK